MCIFGLCIFGNLRCSGSLKMVRALITFWFCVRNDCVPGFEGILFGLELSLLDQTLGVWKLFAFLSVDEGLMVFGLPMSLSMNQMSAEVRRPPEFKHIIKGRKRN
jgi:hypothetical protein